MFCYRIAASTSCAPILQVQIKPGWKQFQFPICIISCHVSCLARWYMVARMNFRSAKVQFACTVDHPYRSKDCPGSRSTRWMHWPLESHWSALYVWHDMPRIQALRHETRNKNREARSEKREWEWWDLIREGIIRPCQLDSMPEWKTMPCMWFGIWEFGNLGNQPMTSIVSMVLFKSIDRNADVAMLLGSTRRTLYNMDGTSDATTAKLQDATESW